MSKPSLVDGHGRQISYMRISLTDKCNFRCIYCMPEKGRPYIPHKEILSFEELLVFCSIVASQGITRFKITGGEPLCRKGAIDFIRQLKVLPNVEQVTLTTNGSLLSHFAKGLKGAGIDGVTISLDSLHEGHFAHLTRSDIPLQTVLQGIEAVAQLGIPVKINVVPLCGYNDADIDDLVEYAFLHNFPIRFIELMPVGLAREYKGVSPQEVKDRIEKKYGTLVSVTKKMGNGPAVYFSLPGNKGYVGFITALSHKFCESCNRIRLTSSGFLKMCLYHTDGLNVKSLLRSDLSKTIIASTIQNAILAKPKAHDFEVKNKEDTFFMFSVGG